ncbi:hypothetical protein BVG16_05615 [Paenibacillus selenitireducens]|uniref:Uncharacterized protein n=1 Tax=Paenibacillus selenitireducens TaxID=1324314 RepID=A0A1T2XK33_9BACL|nr:hypothetical protein [Paenibacillus selenitireducens]OPA80221.1 hypothetical protein BVG16_05615 [Paenibacillus selenitireducens]
MACSSCNKASSGGAANISLKHTLFQVQMVQRQVDLLKKSMRNMQMNIHVKTDIVRKQVLDYKAKIERDAKFKFDFEMNVEPKIILNLKEMIKNTLIFIGALALLKLAVKKLGSGIAVEPKINLNLKEMIKNTLIFIGELALLKLAIKKLGSGTVEYKIKCVIEKCKPPKRTKVQLVKPKCLKPKAAGGGSTDGIDLPPRSVKHGSRRKKTAGSGGKSKGGGLFSGLGKGLGGIGKMLNPFKIIGKVIPMFRLLGPVISKLSPLLIKLGDAFLKGMGKSSGVIETAKKLLDSFQQVLVNLFTVAGQRFAQFLAWLQPKLPAITGFISGVIAQAVQTFAPLLPPIMQIFQSVFGWVVENMPVFQAAIGSVFSALAPVIQTVVSVFQMLWGIWMEAWPTIQSILESVWGVVKPIFDVFTTVVQILMEVVQKLWDNLKPVFEMIWGALKPIIDGIGEMAGVFGDSLNWVLEKISGKPSGGGGSSESDPSKKHAAGLLTVPRDNYPALLHRNEAVLTAQEANQYRNGRSGGGITINLNNPVAREEADFKKWSVMLRTELESAGFNMA